MHVKAMETDNLPLRQRFWRRDVTPKQIDQLREIRALLDEAYRDWSERSDDHHCKSSEGAVEVYYPNWFRQADGADPLEATGLGVFSYVLGPSRMHHFFKKEPGDPEGDYATFYVDDPFAKAVEVVRGWRDEQLAEVYD